MESIPNTLYTRGHEEDIHMMKQDQNGETHTFSLYH